MKIIQKTNNKPTEIKQVISHLSLVRCTYVYNSLYAIIIIVFF